MRYIGGKFRIKNDIQKFFNSLNDRDVFVDLFCGACNIVEGVDYFRRIANDNNPYLIEMFRALVGGWTPPGSISKEEYEYIKQNKGLDMALTGFVGHGTTFSGEWFGGYARDDTKRHYALNSQRSLIKQRSSLLGVEFKCHNYIDLSFPEGAVVYCDIPYQGTCNHYYEKTFDHDQFWEWVQENKKKYRIYISEYARNVPAGYAVVWKRESKREIISTNRIHTYEVIITPL